MSILISLVVAILLLAILVWALGLLPIDSTIVRLLQAAVAIIGALLLLQRFWG